MPKLGIEKNHKSELAPNFRTNAITAFRGAFVSETANQTNLKGFKPALSFYFNGLTITQENSNACKVQL